MAVQRWVVGDLLTGKINRTIDLPDGTWSSDIDDKGTLDGSINLDSGEWLTARADATPAKCYMAVAHVEDDGTEHWQAGGPIWSSTYTDSTGILRLGGAALSSYFDHRKVMPVLAAGQDAARASVNFETARLELIAKRLILAAQQHTGGNLPIVFPTDEELGGEGNDRVRNYPGYELGWVGTRLEQLTQVIGGPEVQFQPRRRTDDPRYLEWVMRIGTAETGMLLQQDGAAWVLDHTVPESPIVDIDVDVDGSLIAFRSWAGGMGEGVTRPIEYVENLELVTTQGWPLLESEVTSLDSVTGRDTLRRHAGNDLLSRSRPVEVWDITIDPESAPQFGHFRAGDWFLVRIRDHLYIPDGDYELRSLAMSRRAGEPVKLSMAPRLGDF